MDTLQYKQEFVSKIEKMQKQNPRTSRGLYNQIIQEYNSYIDCQTNPTKDNAYSKKLIEIANSLQQGGINLDAKFRKAKQEIQSSEQSTMQTLQAEVEKDQRISSYLTSRQKQEMQEQFRILYAKKGWDHKKIGVDIQKIQYMIGVNDDGIFGQKSLQALKEYNKTLKPTPEPLQQQSGILPQNTVETEYKTMNPRGKDVREGRYESLPHIKMQDGYVADVAFGPFENIDPKELKNKPFFTSLNNILDTNHISGDQKKHLLQSLTHTIYNEQQLTAQELESKVAQWGNGIVKERSQSHTALRAKANALAIGGTDGKRLVQELAHFQMPGRGQGKDGFTTYQPIWKIYRCKNAEEFIQRYTENSQSFSSQGEMGIAIGIILQKYIHERMIITPDTVKNAQKSLEGSVKLPNNYINEIGEHFNDVQIVDRVSGIYATNAPRAMEHTKTQSRYNMALMNLQFEGKELDTPFLNLDGDITPKGNHETAIKNLEETRNKVINPTEKNNKVYEELQAYAKNLHTTIGTPSTYPKQWRPEYTRLIRDSINSAIETRQIVLHIFSKTFREDLQKWKGKGEDRLDRRIEQIQQKLIQPENSKAQYLKYESELSNLMENISDPSKLAKYLQIDITKVAEQERLWNFHRNITQALIASQALIQQVGTTPIIQNREKKHGIPMNHSNTVYRALDFNGKIR